MKRPRLSRGTSLKAVRRVRESDLQGAVVHYLNLARPAAIWFHVPNGGHRSPAEAAIFKAMGVRAGVADLVFLAGHGSWCIELKTLGGKLSGVQERFAASCAELGIPHAVCTGVAEVHAALSRWGLVTTRIAVAERQPYREAT